ncbi:MAG: hypothetical protein ABIJ86_08280 [Spirochaetota bacterium]
MTGSWVGRAKGGKLLRLSASWGDGIIESIAIHGDFFAHPEDGFDAAEAALVGQPVDGVSKAFAAALAENSVSLFGLLPEDLDTAFAVMLAEDPQPGTGQS